MSVKLSDFVVLKSLKVHDLKVEKNRVSATYTVTRKDGTVHANKLIYSYSENLFDRHDPEDINLAAIMVAQVAMNYGLFCEELIFEGLYDQHDKRMVLDMTENTSREILVNKLLHPTEFLVPPFDQLKTEKKERYTAAKIVFDDVKYTHLKLKPTKSEPSNQKFAILSSGGKDSLLSYGLLKERFEPHPVFVNESGRHWYTAYNAFHAQQKTEPNLAKVWCNSDRIFNWMVRQMSFIKPNFQNIRSDQYPIRLWTVSVFLHGVLPIARKRNIKNIIIGNEYDTSLKLNHEGITHYAALYDQSKYFDNAFTRYYQKKGWNMYQFSLLRSVSELLILKILVKRYPELQRHQVSCHAAHKEGDRMIPCGNCEKCRRIVGLLSALNEDPKRCGYTDAQISKCLKKLETRSVKQLGADAQQLYFMLTQKGLINVDDNLKRMVKENKEIMKLRFDSERSKLEDLPVEMREFLLNIYNEYTDGMVKLTDRKWVDYQPSANEMNTPYFLHKSTDEHAK